MFNNPNGRLNQGALRCTVFFFCHSAIDRCEYDSDRSSRFIIHLEQLRYDVEKKKKIVFETRICVRCTIEPRKRKNNNTYNPYVIFLRNGAVFIFIF